MNFQAELDDLLNRAEDAGVSHVEILTDLAGMLVKHAATRKDPMLFASMTCNIIKTGVALTLVEAVGQTN